MSLYVFVFLHVLVLVLNQGIMIFVNMNKDVNLHTFVLTWGAWLQCQRIVVVIYFAFVQLLPFK